MAELNMIYLVLAAALGLSLAVFLGMLTLKRRLEELQAQAGPTAVHQRIGPTRQPPYQPAQRAQYMDTEDLAEAMGLPKVLLHELHSILVDGLRTGLVRVTLTSDYCKHGRVYLDVPNRRFMCYQNGQVWPLGAAPSADEVIETIVHPYREQRQPPMQPQAQPGAPQGRPGGKPAERTAVRQEEEEEEEEDLGW